MATPSDDEIEAIKKYVWRNYPERCQPHECLPNADEILAQLPERLKIIFRNSVKNSEQQEKVTADDAGMILEVVTQLETKRFLQLVDIDSLEIARCPACRKTLVNRNSRQCLHCGLDWHG